MQKKTILITGGAGFLGSNLAAALAEHGEDVLIFDNLSRPMVEHNLSWLKQEYGDRISMWPGDVRDAGAVASAVMASNAVFHLAAQVAVTTSLDDPLDDFEANARGTLNVLEAVRFHASHSPVIFASTNKVYGKLLRFEELSFDSMRYTPLVSAKQNGFSEQTPLSFYSPYGCSKGAADQYVLDYARIYGPKTCVFRMSCLHGPHQYGHEDQGWVAHFLISALTGQPLTIYGDGGQVRDILYVDDAVMAWLAALDEHKRLAGHVFNLGGGPSNTVSLKELIVIIEQMTGRAPSLSFSDWRVPLFPYPGSPDYRKLWGVPDDRAWERAVSYYLGRYGSFSDIQDQQPVPLDLLEHTP